MKTAREIQRHPTYLNKTQTLNQMIEERDATIRKLKSDLHTAQTIIANRDEQIIKLEKQIDGED